MLALGHGERWVQTLTLVGAALFSPPQRSIADPESPAIPTCPVCGPPALDLLWRSTEAADRRGPQGSVFIRRERKCGEGLTGVDIDEDAPLVFLAESRAFRRAVEWLPKWSRPAHPGRPVIAADIRRLATISILLRWP